MDWFTSDSHCGHANIIKHCNRPFINVHEMNKGIIDNINSVVKASDVLYHLGDFSWKKTAARYRKKIRCRNVILILGNHDPQTKNGQPLDILHEIFSQVFVMLRIKPIVFGSQQPIILSHYAMRTWNGSHRGSWNLFGHSHGTLPDNESKSLDVGVDKHDYRPINLETVANLINQRK